MYTVYYKTEDQAPWKVEGSYDSESKAQANAWELLTDGYIIKVEEE